MNSPTLKAVLLAVLHIAVALIGALAAFFALGASSNLTWLVVLRKVLIIFIPTLFVVHLVNKNTEKELQENFKPLYLVALVLVGAGYMALEIYT